MPRLEALIIILLVVLSMYVCVCWLLDFLLLDILNGHFRNMILGCITIQNDCQTKHL